MLEEISKSMGNIVNKGGEKRYEVGEEREREEGEEREEEFSLDLPSRTYETNKDYGQRNYFLRKWPWEDAPAYNFRK